MKFNIKYYFESAYWIIKWEFKEMGIGAKHIFSIRLYAYILLAVFVFILIKNVRNVLFYLLGISLIYIFYKKIKGGGWKGYMRKEKGGYSLKELSRITKGLKKEKDSNIINKEE